ncbi:insulinase family protein [Lentzea sp. NPDC051838]|uniref:insulinase family protein n=1 Tax=Lentzea sp. NPDC051838 TaxID=3154849 RepID=UPI00343D746B
MIRHTEVDGVPTVIAPADGPMNAGLIFRVGVADETYVTSGITHLVEHLALSGLASPDFHANGMTRMVNTHFYTVGSPDEVGAFLTRVCDALTSLPIDRFEAERTIVRTEAASRGSSPGEEVSAWRYGAQGYGLAAANDFGVDLLRPRDVVEWAADWFTRENAVLWITGDDVPEGLRLRLPGGVRRPPPPATSVPPVLPAYFDTGEGRVSMGAVVRRSMGAIVLSQVIERRLFQKLRQDLGGSYLATASYETRDAEHMTITALADTLPENQDVVVKGFIETLLALKAGDVPAADVDAAKAALRTVLSAPAADTNSVVILAATDLLNRGRCSTAEELLAETEAVTPSDVHVVAVEAMGSAVLQVPEGHEADWAGFARVPTWSSSAVAGTMYSTFEPSELGLVIGDTGASLITPGGVITVRYDQCVLMDAWPHGGRDLMSADGKVLPINPRQFDIDPRAIAVVDAHVPASVVVWRPPLPEESAEVTAEEAVAEAPRIVQRRARTWPRTVARVIAWVLFTSWLVFTLLATAGMAAKDDATAGSWIAVGILWFIGWPFNALFRGRRRLRTAP